MGQPPAELERLGEVVWRLPRRGAMRVAARVHADEALLAELARDGSLAQLALVAELEGAAGEVLGLCDLQQGEAWPSGCVCAVGEDGPVVPAAIGAEVHCGVRLLAVRGVKARAVRRHRGELADDLARAVPAGAERGGPLALRAHELDQVGRGGARWAVERGLGRSEDLDGCEDGGVVAWAEPAHVSADARVRAAAQLGTLGAGSHFVEVGVLEELDDAGSAQDHGLTPGGVCVLVHTGSRGLGRQVQADYTARMLAAEGPPSAPLRSDLARAYLGALGAAANFALANRQVVTQRVREVLARRFGGGAEVAVVSDLAHHSGRLERHRVDGVERELFVHRNGATRVLAAGHPDLSPARREHGLPLVVLAGVGAASHLLVPAPAAGDLALGSCCHAAGRRLHPAAARRAAAGRDLRRELARLGVSLRATGSRALADELAQAQRDGADAVEIARRAGLAHPLARLRPVVVVRG